MWNCLGMDLTQLNPADRHRRVAALFDDLVVATPDWDACTPVEEWTAVEVVGHLIDWLPGMLAGGGVDLPIAEVEQGWRIDPVAAWRSRAKNVQAVLDDPARASATYRSEMLGEMPMVELIDRFWTPDIYMHSWDLARAGGLDADLDEHFAEALLSGLESTEEMIRASKQFGVRQRVDPDASVVDRLIAFIGRDPNWEG